jgi:hypothetical protein
MISTCLVVSGVFTGIMGLLDMFLSNNQKAKLADRTVNCWDRLDEAHRFSLYGWLFRPGFRIWFVAAPTVLGMGASVAFLLLGGKMFTTHWFFVAGCVLAAILTGGPIGMLMLRHIISRPSKTAFLWAFLYLFIIAAAAAAIIPYGLAEMKTARIGAFLGNRSPDLVRTGLALWGIYSLVVVVLYWLVAALPVVLVGIAQVMLALSELVVRKIAESPKGVIMGLSGLLASAGGILRAF